ncbi:MAG TPA: hypothetical protein PKY50_05985 [Candidatus Competibacter sp.]|nr:hypothetical protein [Candidatus Competibacter sp.]
MPIKPENIARYPKNWATEIRPAILERAGHACERCGAVNYQPNPQTGSRVILTVAHIHDQNPENCDPSNLQALCQRCHNRLDAPMRASHARETRRRRLASGDLFQEHA